MPKLNQIVAVVSGKKTRMEKDFGDLNKIVQKTDLFNGLSRTYTPLKEDGEKFPSETKLPQQSVADILQQLHSLFVGIADAIATQEFGNTLAKADIKVGTHTVLTGVPLCTILYLEKQLNDLNTFVSNFPVLDPAEQWIKEESTGQWKTPPTLTIKTKKTQKPLIMVPATDKFPAQVQLITDDENVGNWTTIKASAVMALSDKKAILERIQKLSEAVKFAREEANSIEVVQQKIAEPILKYIFGTQ